ncbi:hypothetical protein O1L55_05420 [Streptomyces albulus]|nr:hypothetical protein [Streptomyces noursei]
MLARLKTPLAGLLRAAATGALATFPPLRWSDGAAVTVVIASHNYPGTPRTGDPIDGLAEVAEQDAPTPTCCTPAPGAGTDGAVLSAGGRVLSVTATGADLATARERAYRSVDRIALDGAHHRTDIAARAAAGE